jgi:hypothetical protein
VSNKRLVAELCLLQSAGSRLNTIFAQYQKPKIILAKNAFHSNDRPMKARWRSSMTSDVVSKLPTDDNHWLMGDRGRSAGCAP